MKKEDFNKLVDSIDEKNNGIFSRVFTWVTPDGRKGCQKYLKLILKQMCEHDISNENFGKMTDKADEAWNELTEEQHLLLKSLSAYLRSRISKKGYSPYTNLGPGDYITTELKERNWSQNHLAELMGISRQHLSRLIHNKSPVTENTAKLLSNIFKQSPEFWMNAQKRYKKQINQKEN